MAVFNVNLDDTDYDTLDAGLRLEPGWYRVILDDCFDEPKNDSTTFAWKVTHGPHKGTKHQDWLRSPEMAESDRAKEMATRRVLGFGKRFGLIKEGEKGDKPLDFKDCIGWEGVIHVIKRTYPDKKTGLPVESIEVDFMGVYANDHTKIPVEIRVALGLPLLPGQVAPVPGQPAGKANGRGKAAPAPPPSANPPKVDTSDL